MFHLAKQTATHEGRGAAAPVTDEPGEWCEVGISLPQSILVRAF